MPDLVKNLRGTNNFVYTTVDSIVSATQSVHFVISDTGYKILNESIVEPDKLNILKKTHDDITHEIYGAIRDINITLNNFVKSCIKPLSRGENNITNKK